MGQNPTSSVNALLRDRESCFNELELIEQTRMVLLQNQPALLGTSGGLRRLTLPLRSPEFPSEVMRGRVIGVGTRGCREGLGGLARRGVRMGMVDIADMDDRPTDRFGIEPIPIRRKYTCEQCDTQGNQSKTLGVKVKFLNGLLLI